MLNCSKSKIVVLFQYFLNKFALYIRQMVGKVVGYVTLMLVKICFDAVDESIAAQSLLYSFSDIEQCFLNGFAPV